MAGLLQEVGNSLYRWAGRAAAQLLGSSGIVRSILIHRGVAAGEVAFGRSDIDLLLVVRQPASDLCDGPELAALGRTVRWIHTLAPVVGQMEVHDPAGIQRWVRTDPYRGSQERRGAILVYGPPVEFAVPPIRTEHAARRLLICLHTFLSTAVWRGSRRNLRKFALDAWNAYATATQRTAEPYVSRREAETHCRLAEGGALADDWPGSPQEALGFLFRTAERLHARLLAPLEGIRRPVVFRAQLPPGFQERTFVVLPHPGYPLPPEAFHSSAFLCTPEALDLYVHYSNAFLYWALPPDLLRLGICAPDVEAFVRSCRYFGDTHKLRYPIFMKNTQVRPAVGRVVALRHAVEYLRGGRIPPPLGRRQLEEALAAPADCRNYYEAVFPRLYSEAERLWERLEELPEVATQRGAASLV